MAKPLFTPEDVQFALAAAYAASQDAYYMVQALELPQSQESELKIATGFTSLAERLQQWLDSLEGKDG